MSSPPRRSRARARAAALGCAAALALIGALELGLRLAGYGGRAPLDLVHDARALPGVAQFLPAQRDGRSGLIRADDRCGYALAAPYRSSPQHAGTYAVGAWPGRGRPAEPAPPGLATVLVLGDSNAYGIGVETADTLSERLAIELEERGFPREALLVVNLGVPGYSTVQIERVLGPALKRHRPVAVVLYVAAWNDQAPASLLPDEELLDRLARRGPLADSALADLLSARRPASRPVSDDEAADAHHETLGWLTSGAAPHGPRVPEDEIEERVRRMLDAVQSRGAVPLVIAPGHPHSTELAHPRVVRDRESVVRAASSAGVALVDAEALALATKRPDAELFLDLVHPAPILWQIVASHVADELAPRLTGVEVEAAATTLVIRSIEPRAASSLGDTRFTVEVEGASDRGPLPVITVGGAPLVDLERRDGPASSTRFIGTLIKNSPGRHDVLVQDAIAGVVIERAAITLVPPTVSRTADGRIVVTSRPHDRALVFLSARSSPHAVQSTLGPSLISIAHILGAPIELDLGESGSAEVALPSSAAPESTWLQALIIPRGEAPGSQEARLTNALGPAGG